MARKNNRQILENLEVIDAGAKGKAVAKALDGRVVFIDNAVPGDVVTVQTFKKKKAFYEATVLSISKYSEKRVEPVCPHFGVCGGCKWQHVDYQAQLEAKRESVREALVHHGGFTIAASELDGQGALTPDAALAAVEGLHRRAQGGYAAVALVLGLGLVAFRDPNGIRPCTPIDT